MSAWNLMSAAPSPAPAPQPQARGGWLHTARAVGWAFLGVRRASGLQHDMQRLHPLKLVVMALLAVALFVGGLIGLVHWVV